VSSSEEAQIAKGGEMNVRAVTDVADAVAWRARRVIFRERRLDFIAEEFNRYSRKKIVLDGPGVESRVYTGVFDADDVESLAQVLARDPALVVDNSQESITVKVR
jgi:transmembrane sensor